MFLEKYINEFYYKQVLKNYDIKFLSTLDEDNFKKIYKVFQLFNCYFIDDIILKYLEIFTLDSDEVYLDLSLLKNKLGENFMYIIGTNMSYLSELLK